MLAYLWPVGLIVITNVIYNIATKSTPAEASPYLALVITYLTGTVTAFVLYLLSRPQGTFVEHFRTLNWTSWLLGFAIVGLEVGYIYLYRTGWNISIGSIVCNILLAVALIVIGVFFYKEQIRLVQIAGIVCCFIGLVLINWK
ncbi:MAG: EamA family transporter [Oscillospiraceae bacterium]|jgi:drug/metabolite transporter (DMT)-like permease